MEGVEDGGVPALRNGGGLEAAVIGVNEARVFTVAFAAAGAGFSGALLE